MPHIAHLVVLSEFQSTSHGAKLGSRNSNDWEERKERQKREKPNVCKSKGPVTSNHRVLSTLKRAPLWGAKKQFAGGERALPSHMWASRIPA